MSQITTKKVGEVGECFASNYLQFNLVTSIRAGWARNKTLLADSIQITPVDELGILELYCKNVTETIVATERELSYGIYELRWTSKRESFGSKPIVINITYEYEFIRYTEVESAVIFLLRKKKAHEDRFPYFFWNRILQ
ncbi:hypothetical protein JH06_0353 [Blastocystis sp. subtype 4]|uniref:hypothetical protein n=1 Tax=Blastocystis sp. subtype 4 TaxID=944170 RepID=UPI0007116500|nr:hypothetical protein JH06_0353 [Blastocystis sp. subtype 4]KNB46595.1 hypothetical protein JH06_0353 [Blastocystis sp. subtype 4]|eukprot:XP_014530038.1 hypothetical protein JH06_0353 [Blastocystis sp. subtype 4]